MNRKNIMPGDRVENTYGIKPAPCPFCGCPHIGMWCGPMPHMTCEKCEADGPLSPRNADHDQRHRIAVILWNERIPMETSDE
jgi:hypothetical protein